jgi:hypothetical protein
MEKPLPPLPMEDETPIKDITPTRAPAPLLQRAFLANLECRQSALEKAKQLGQQLAVLQGQLDDKERQIT